jgi:hypothetical protein
LILSGALCEVAATPTVSLPANGGVTTEDLSAAVWVGMPGVGRRHPPVSQTAILHREGEVRKQSHQQNGCVHKLANFV